MMEAIIALAGVLLGGVLMGVGYDSGLEHDCDCEHDDD